MDNFKNFLLLLWGAFFVFIIFQIISYFRYLQKLKKLKSTPFPKNLKKYIENLPQYQKLNEKQKRILEYKIQRFLLEKNFIHVNINLNDEIKTLIAFYACLPSIAYIDFCYPNLKNIYIYPHPVILKNLQNGYVVQEEEIIEGEATGENVIIAWDEAKKEIHHPNFRNVIIHEFAHQLDAADGVIDGIPPIETSKYNEWVKIMFGEYKKFKQKTLKNRFLGKFSLIDKYAATNEAEFFAVMSEYYFMKPQILKKHFPDIYKELKNFYKIEFI